MCEGKKAYDTDWQAKFAADECFQLRGARLSWYKCEFCGLWHLTSSNLKKKKNNHDNRNTNKL